MSTKIQKSDAEWRAALTPEQYRVLREHGTERPFTGELLHNKETGTYHCAGCGQALFASDTKFDSGSGWPSFWDVIDKGNVALVTDSSYGMRRTEVRCGNCGGHLGHVFEDGPRQTTGLRYCINSAALNFQGGEE
ncbi:MAG: peptide-methionine (R)-S-oxide reductase MsrB [Anaerolineae bacterium]|nr:peptide-methionine (R)-S-oxide reductase MsrB [Anaerolineae bacterium]